MQQESLTSGAKATSSCNYTTCRFEEQLKQQETLTAKRKPTKVKITLHANLKKNSSSKKHSCRSETQLK
jgi:hypothetical protein